MNYITQKIPDNVKNVQAQQVMDHETNISIREVRKKGREEFRDNGVKFSSAEVMRNLELFQKKLLDSIPKGIVPVRERKYADQDPPTGYSKKQSIILHNKRREGIITNLKMESEKINAEYIAAGQAVKPEKKRELSQKAQQAINGAQSEHFEGLISSGVSPNIAVSQLGTFRGTIAKITAKLEIFNKSEA